jgi:hypothetical protein
MILNTFGKLPKGQQRKGLRASPNYSQGAFQNLEPTTMMAADASYFKIMRSFFLKQKDTHPKQPLQFTKTDLKAMDKSLSSVVWFGHSGYFLNLKGLTILVDPVLSGHASPLPGMVKAFPGTDLYQAEDFPDIDLLVITHDHYDHLDHHFFSQIRSKVRRVVCSLGVGAHLRHWNLDAESLTELDWQESFETDAFKITARPGRHFSGRGLIRNQSLWSSFVLKTPHEKLFLGGDSGYGQHFKMIGDLDGPFDLAILECGQYNANWPMIHMMPEQTVKAAKDLKAQVLLPVHWGKFKLALHPWTEPAERVLAEANKTGQALIFPAIGECFPLTKKTTAYWWRQH